MPAWFSTVTTIGFVFLSLASIFIIIRLIRGPTVADRVIAIDLMAVVAVCLIALFTLVTNQAIYIDIALAVALVAFVSTLAYARFIEWKTEENISRTTPIKPSKENRL